MEQDTENNKQENIENETTENITLLQKVKNTLAITTDDIDNNLTSKIEAIKQYLIQAGAIIDDDNVSDAVVNTIAIGVNDLLNNKAGETKFSPAFNILTKQIIMSLGK